MAKKTKEKVQLQKLRDVPAEEFISTGIPEVDELLGGGFPRRRITQVWGVPGSGKSYMLAKCLSKLDGKALYVDAEFALNRDRLAQMGVDLDEIDYMANSQLEEVANYILENIDKYDLIVIDTLAKLTPMSVAENDMSTPPIAIAARMIGQFEAKLRPKLFTSRAAVVGINQARANMGYGQAESKPAGGWSWAHTIDISLKLARTGYVYKQVKGEKVGAGQITSVKVDKSRVSAPATEVRFKILYDGGDDVEGTA